MLFRAFYAKSYYQSGENCMLFREFYSVILRVWGELHDFLGILLSHIISLGGTA